MKSFLQKIIAVLWKTICWPFKTVGNVLGLLEVIGDTTGMFVLWMLFTIFGGLMGPLITVCIEFTTHTEGYCKLFLDAVEKNAKAGTFYTYSVALLASSVGSILLALWTDNNRFSKIKLLFLAFAIFPMLFSAISYSSIIIPTGFDVNWKMQCTLWIVSIIFAIFSYCLQFITLHPEKYGKYTDDYMPSENARIQNTASNGQNVSSFEGAEL